jgi:DNA invertase Pin-like site-specific DNA recombinase
MMKLNTARQIAENAKIKDGTVALYARLSRDDELLTESNSITNQKQFLENYALQNGFTNTCVYQDDGFSGTGWDRPGWQSLINDVEAGRVQVIILKNLDRMGRDYIRVGLYLEMFRERGVRLIAINDGIDTISGEDDFTPFRAILAEFYARDISRKIKTAKHSKGNSGKPMTNVPIYGYKRHPDDKNIWIVDEEAAAIVRRIFQLTMDGIGTMQITRILIADKVERPSYYMVKNNLPRAPRTTCDMVNPYAWNSCTVARLLSKPEYAGHTVNFRSSRESYKDKKSKNNPKEDWKIFHNTHEPLVSQEVFDTVQKLRGTKRRADSLGVPNPLTGLVYCADCEKKMFNSRSKGGFTEHRNGKTYQHKGDDSYDCSTYNMGRGRLAEPCSGHYIRTAVIRELVLDMIRKICGYVRENQAEFVRQIREESVLQRGETAKSHKKSIAKNERRIAELDNLFRKIYEDNARGELSDKRFKQMSEGYEREQAELEVKNSEMQSELDEFNADSDNVESFIGLVRKYTEFEELTTQMLNEFIHRIIVHKPIKTEWERQQRVDIIFNFIGEFTLPTVEAEPTPEEIAAEEKRRAKLRKQREANRRCYAKQKAEYERRMAEEASE